MMYVPSKLGIGVPLLALATAAAACSVATLPERAPSAGIDGGAPACNAPSAETPLFDDDTGVAVDGLFVFGNRAFFSLAYELFSVPLGGGPPTSITLGAGVAIVGGTLYTVDNHLIGTPDSDGKQSSAPALYATPFTGISPDTGASGGGSTLIQDNFVDGPTVTDGASLYVANGTSNEVLKITPPSTTPVTLTFDGTLSIRALAVDATYLYAAVGETTTSSGDGVIVRMPKSDAGGPTDRLLTLPGYPDNLLVDDQALYWIDQPAVGTFGNTRVVRADLDGQNETPLVDDSNSVGSPTEIALGPSDLYFTSDSLLARLPKAGGAIETIATDLSGAGLLQISGADVVWVDNYYRALSSTSPTPIEALCAGSPAPPDPAQNPAP
ncbi:MAG TPA: hypothetical protein VLC06_24615 [Polyangia bacterium]|nr:hypothetical protein [Polyangia bacterium]